MALYGTIADITIAGAIQSVSTSITLCDPLKITHSAFLVIYVWYCQFLNSNLCSAAKQAYLKMISYSLLFIPTLIFRVFSIILYGLKISFHMIIIFQIRSYSSYDYDSALTSSSQKTTLLF